MRSVTFPPSSPTLSPPGFRASWRAYVKLGAVLYAHRCPSSLSRACSHHPPPPPPPFSPFSLSVEVRLLIGRTQVHCARTRSTRPLRTQTEHHCARTRSTRPLCPLAPSAVRIRVAGPGGRSWRVGVARERARMRARAHFCCVFSVPSEATSPQHTLCQWRCATERRRAAAGARALRAVFVQWACVLRFIALDSEVSGVRESETPAPQPQHTRPASHFSWAYIPVASATTLLLGFPPALL